MKSLTPSLPEVILEINGVTYPGILVEGNLNDPPHALVTVRIDSSGRDIMAMRQEIYQVAEIIPLFRTKHER